MLVKTWNSCIAGGIQNATATSAGGLAVSYLPRVPYRVPVTHLSHNSNFSPEFLHQRDGKVKTEIMLSENSQIQKTTFHVWKFQKRQTVVRKRWTERFLNFLYLDGSGSYKTVCYCKSPAGHLLGESSSV